MPLKLIASTLLVGLMLFVSGCAAPQTANNANDEVEDIVLTKSFYGRTINYTVDMDARPYMTRLERLLEQVIPDDKKDADGRLKEQHVLVLYRDADRNRDYHITETEAENYYRQALLRLEDGFSDPWLDIK